MHIEESNLELEMAEFLPDCSAMQESTAQYYTAAEIEDPAAVIENTDDESAIALGDSFATEIIRNEIADFKKPGDLMVHVSTSAVINNTIYVTYYANTKTTAEQPKEQVARLAFCPADNTKDITYIDLQQAGDYFGGKQVTAVYDTIMLNKDEDTLFVMWTASLEGKYYRLYRTYTISTDTLSRIHINKFTVNGKTNDFSSTGIYSLLISSGIRFKKGYGDIGIMQKLSTHTENGNIYYYTGCYIGNFNCIIKSRDLINWEYVSTPDFPNKSLWENAVYVIGDKVYYFVRQENTTYGFLTCYDLNNKAWDKPVIIADCQSRSDFTYYKGKLYLVHAPIDREHIGITLVDTDNIANSREILLADMKHSCFYPFVNEHGGKFYFSYTDSRKHIFLSYFDLDNYAQ